MPPNLTGYYCFVSQKNMEDYLQALNINMALRKIALLLKPDKEIDHQGNHMTVKTLSTFRNYVVEFEVGVEFEEDLSVVDGRKCQTIVTWEEEQLVCVQKGEVPNRGWKHWLEGENLYLITLEKASCHVTRTLKFPMKRVMCQGIEASCSQSRE
ncbi:retinol-binding protein 5 isoform X1 [Pteropus medius]|uniref:retinol-binding protein 5 isoform X1 n=1 Tax=Pteropus vampyrus TaxID=132908 RepID=UPI00196B6DBF|nr:retinol-binding protein 5 isoform X1 [Pteropus giganteus]XP_039730178.1 retinol-binding protein 5 isoform X1 [Pteropus giganteus]